MDIKVILKDYPNSQYFNQQLLALADNGDIEVLVDIGADFARSEMMEHAVACWQYVIDSGHGTAEAYSNLGVSYYYGNGISQDFEKAVQYYQRAAAKDHPMGMYNLAVACESGNGTPKDYGKAVKYYRMAADKGVNQAIDALIRLGLYDELSGLAFYQRNINNNSFSPSNNFNSCLDLAKSKHRLAIVERGTILGSGFKDEAIEYYKKAISFKETYEVLFAIASLYNEFDEYDNAIEYYKKSIIIKSSSYEAYNDMGYCYYQMKDDAMALDCYKKSFAIKPSSMVLRNIGNCYKNFGEIAMYRKCYYDADMMDKVFLSKR